MKKFLLTFCLLLSLSVLANAQTLFSQKFITNTADQAATNAVYGPNGTTAEGKFSYLSGASISVSGGALNLTRSTGTITTGITGLSGTSGGDCLMYKFDYLYTGTTGAIAEDKFWLNVGQSFININNEQTASNIYAKLKFSAPASGVSTAFKISNGQGGTSPNVLSTAFAGKQTIRWVLNNTGAAVAYVGPDGSANSVANDTFDLWIGYTKVFAGVAVKTPGANVKDFHLINSLGTNATHGLSNFNISKLATDGSAFIGSGETLTSFKALDVNSTSVRLDWTTVHEVNTSRFDVTRSSDGINFTTIGNVTAAGNSTNQLKYKYTDNSPLSGTNYYQLQMVNAQGIITKSDIMTVLSGTSYTSVQPRNLNLIYFIPNNVDYTPDYSKRLSELMLWGQNWFGQQIQNNGYGFKTFGMLKNAAGNRIKIITIFGSQSKSAYSGNVSVSNNDANLKAEINAYFAAHPTEKTGDHNLVIIPRYGYEADGVRPTGGPFHGSMGWCFARDYEEMDFANLGRTDALGDRFSDFFGGMIHELGHGFNLQHNREKKSETNDPNKGMSLMWAGNGTLGKTPTFLTSADCAILNTNQIFNNDTQTYYGAVTASIDKIYGNYSTAKNAIVVSGKFTSSVPVSDVNYYNDPNVNNEGTGINNDYNAITWASKVIGVDSFYVEMPINELVYTTDYTYELKIKLIHANGSITETVYPYRFVNGQLVMNINTRNDLSKTGWTIASFSSQEGSKPASNVIDGNKATFWMSRWSVLPATSYPHEIIINTGKNTISQGLTFIQEQSLARPIKDFEILSSNDGVNFNSLGNYLAVYGRQPQYFDFSGLQTFRYFKVIAKSGWDGTQYASIAELGLYPNQHNTAPTLSITSPANNAIFTAGSNVSINVNATDSDGVIDKVEFYQGSTLLGQSTIAPYSFTWDNVFAGNYGLTAKATDNLGAVKTSSVINMTVNAAVPTAFTPVADAYVRDGAFANTNFGTGALLEVNRDGLSYLKASYLRFDYTPFTGSTVSNTKLRMYVYGASQDPSRVISVYGLTNTTWGETTINWTNKPTETGTLIGTYTINNASAVWYELNVTSYINNQLALGNKIVSFRLINEGAVSVTNNIRFNSREASSNKPQLILIQGAIPTGMMMANSPKTISRIVEPTTLALKVTAWPNPSTNEFKVQAESNSNETLQIRVYNVGQQLVKQLKTAVSEILTFGGDLPAGVYLIEAQQGAQRKVIKVIKL